MIVDIQKIEIPASLFFELMEIKGKYIAIKSVAENSSYDSVAVIKKIVQEDDGCLKKQ